MAGLEDIKRKIDQLKASTPYNYTTEEKRRLIASIREKRELRGVLNDEEVRFLAASRGAFEPGDAPYKSGRTN